MEHFGLFSQTYLVALTEILEIPSGTSLYIQIVQCIYSNLSAPMSASCDWQHFKFNYVVKIIKNNLIVLIFLAKTKLKIEYFYLHNKWTIHYTSNPGSADCWFEMKADWDWNVGILWSLRRSGALSGCGKMWHFHEKNCFFLSYFSWKLASKMFAPIVILHLLRYSEGHS
jgi:hypothetical protein